MVVECFEEICTDKGTERSKGAINLIKIWSTAFQAEALNSQFKGPKVGTDLAVKEKKKAPAARGYKQDTKGER